MTPEQIAALQQAAHDYIHQPVSTDALDSCKEGILLLRAKYASYETIAMMLDHHGLRVPLATVRKFCRRHHGEVRRLRAEIAAAKKTTASDPEPAPPKNEARPASKKSRSLRGPV
jgi:uncharacterized protein (DUF305 family)